MTGLMRLTGVIGSVLLAGLAPERAGAYDPAVGDFSRRNPDDLRVLCYNVQRTLTDPTTTPQQQRVIRAIDPDIVMFQEIDVNETNAEIAAWMEDALPQVAPAAWSAYRGQTDSFIRCAIASRYPLSLQRSDTVPTSEVRGLNMAAITMRADRALPQLYVINGHFKAGGTESDETRRQVYGDAIASWIRDIQNPGGTITLTNRHPILVGGDTNLRESTTLSLRVQNTITTGDIFDEATYGADNAPDWDGSALTDVRPRDPFTNTIFTWSSTDPGLRFDRLYLSDSVIAVPTSFVFNTATMTASARTAAGVQATDTATAADHLPIVIDLRPVAMPNGAWMVY